MVRFQHASLKLKWAGHHIDQLHAYWQGYIKTDFCKLVVKSDPAGREVLCIEANPLPAQLVLTLGDAVHNMRCALDFAVNDILGGRDTRLTFPMGETREEVIAALSTDPGAPCGSCGRGGKKGRAARVEESVPGIAVHFVETIRPYKASGSLLWVLNKLDVRDKHRLLMPAVGVSEITGINGIDANGNRLSDLSGGVSSGGVVRMIGSSGGLKIESYDKPAAEILLDEPGVIERASLFPTLINMHKAVGETLSGLDEFLAATEAA